MNLPLFGFICLWNALQQTALITQHLHWQNQPSRLPLKHTSAKFRAVSENWESPSAVQSFWILKPSRVLWKSLQCAGLPTFHSKYMNESCVRNIWRGERRGNTQAPRDERTRGTDTKELHSLLIPFMNPLKGEGYNINMFYGGPVGHNFELISLGGRSTEQQGDGGGGNLSNSN